MFTLKNLKESLSRIQRNNPRIVECSHTDKHKYKLVVRNNETDTKIRKRLCSSCAKADLDNNRVFVSLY